MHLIKLLNTYSLIFKNKVTMNHSNTAMRISEKQRDITLLRDIKELNDVKIT